MSNVRLLYLLVDETSPPAERVERRLREGQAAMPEGWTFAVESIDIGPLYYEENVVGHAMAVPGIIHAVLAHQHCFDAILIGCFGDPGLAAARAVAKIPIIGPAEASFLLTRLFARRFGVVTMGAGDVPMLEEYLVTLGLGTRCVGMEPVGVAIGEVFEDVACTTERLRRASKKLLAQGAEAVVLGCMSLGFHPFAEVLRRELEVAVVDPLRASVAALQAITVLGVRLGPPSPELEHPQALAEFLARLETMTPAR